MAGQGFSAGQTIIQYGDGANSVIIYRCDATQIEQRPVLEESGTDLKNWRFIVRGVGYIHGWPNGAVLNGPVIDPIDGSGGSARIQGQGAAPVLMQNRWRLPPRQRFWMATGCTSNSISSGKRTLFADPLSETVNFPDLGPESLTTPRTCKDSTGDCRTDPQFGQTGLSLCDVNDGPRNLQFDVIHVAGGNIFKVAYAFEVNLVLCKDQDQSTNTTGVLSHRWSCTDQLDANYQTVRSYSGTLELATAAFNPHWFRYLVVPPIQYGFRRDHMSFQATTDGKKLRYDIVDVAVARTPPPPATQWQVEHHESFINQSPVISQSSCTVTLQGDTDVNKADLITLGLYIITAKLIGVKPGDPQPGLVTLKDLQIVDYTGDFNRVVVSATAQRPLQPMEVEGNNVVNGMTIPNVGGFQDEITKKDFIGLPAGANYDFKRSQWGGYVGEAPLYSGPEPLTTIFSSILSNSCNPAFYIGGRENISGGGVNNGTNMLFNDWNRNADPNRIDAPTFDATEVSDIPGQQDTLGAYYSQAAQTNPYTHYQCETKVSKNCLRAAMPIAKNPTVADYTDSTAIVQIGPIQATMEVRLEAERIGDWPQCPDPEMLGGISLAPGQTQYATISAVTTQQIYGGGQQIISSGQPPITMKCLESTLLPRTSEPTANGQQTFFAGFQAKYALSRAPGPYDILKLGHNMWGYDNSGQGTVSTPALTNSIWT